jgi:hypothetical protein
MSKLFKPDNNITLATIADAQAYTFFSEGQIVYIRELGRDYVVTATSDLEDAPFYRIIDTAGSLKLKRADDILYNTFRDGEGVRFHDEVGVGTIGNPKELVVGEGDSTPEGMLVYDFDGSVFTDISAIAGSSAGSQFSFPNNVANNALYCTMTTLDSIGAKFIPKGIKVKMNTPADYTIGDLIFEYWNGLVWTKLNVMSIEDKPPYYSFGEKPFQALLNDSEQIYFDIASQSTWTVNDPVSLGTDYYWFRIRIVNALATPPLFEQFKIHTSRFEANSDGFTQKFGNARTRKQLKWALGDLEAAGSSPANQDVFLSDTLDVGRVENNFLNTELDRAALNVFLPEDCDTSSPIKLRFSTLSSNASAGNVNFTIRTGYSVEGDNVYRSLGAAPTTHPTQIDYPAIAPAPGLDTQTTYEVNIDISKLNANPKPGTPGNTILWVSFERNGPDATDTHSGNVALISFDASYVEWCEGSYATQEQLTQVSDFTDDFETGSFVAGGWTTVNSPSGNCDWVVGSAEAESGTFSAYISDDGGTTASYTATGGATNISHVYVDVPIPAAVISPQLFFNWQGQMEDGPAFDDYDFMKVYAVPTSTTPVADTLLSEVNRLGEIKYLGQSSWQSETLNIPGSFIGSTVRLVFSFQTDVSIVNLPSACIDNIQVFHFV